MMLAALTACLLFMPEARAWQPPPAVAGFLKRHPELRLVENQDLDEMRCVPPGASEEIVWLRALEEDLTGDALKDAAFVVVSRRSPRTFGAVVLRKMRSGYEEHWIVQGSSRVTGGVAVHQGPHGNWLLIAGCPMSNQKSYLWTGRAFEGTPVK